MPEQFENLDLCARTNRLLQAYADNIDRGDCEGVAALFTEHGRWDHAVGVSLAGRESILAHLREGMHRFARTHHHVGPAALFRLEDGGLQSTAYFIATHVLQGGEAYTVWGRYVDRIAEGSQLLLDSRQTVVHLTEGTDREYRMLSREPLPD